MQTRQIFSTSADGTVGVVFTQRLLPNGTWHNQSARPATPYEMNTKSVDPEEAPAPAPEPAPEVKSGSHNTHARLSPSSSKQWTACTASIAYIEANRHRIPKDTGSVWSREGTEAHDWAAKVLTGACALLDVPADFRQPVGDYCTHCMELTPAGVTPLVEVQAPLFYQPSGKGTCDFAVVSDSLVIVRDYKHGAGVLVHSEENTQLAIYAMSLIRHLEDVYNFGPDTEVNIMVYQPRHREGDTQRPWVLTLADLEAFCSEKITPRAKLAFEGLKIVKGIKWGERATCKAIASAATMTEFAPSEGDDGACRWCDARAFCEARTAAGLEGIPHSDPVALLEGMEDLDKALKKAEPMEKVQARRPELEITEELLVSLYASKKFILDWLSDIEDYLQAKADAGAPVKGTKLVMGRQGNRAWRNEEEAETFLKGQKLKMEERFTFKLKSPTQIEEVLKEKLESSTRTRNRFQELISRSDAKPVLALATDKREAVVGALDGLEAVEEEFEI